MTEHYYPCELDKFSCDRFFKTRFNSTQNL